MKTVVGSLIALQTIDNEVRNVAKARDELNEKLERLQSIVSRMEAGLEEKKQRLTEAERWYKEKSEELQQDQEKVKRAKGRLTTVTKAKEYQATIREIEGLRKSNAQKDEEILKLLTAIEEFKQGIARDQEELDKVRSDVDETRQANAGRLTEMEATIAEVARRRVEIEKDVPGPILKRYKLIASRRDGLAVVEVLEGQCLGCFRKVQPQLYNVLLKAETLETCPHCSRFIFVPEAVGVPRTMLPAAAREPEGAEQA